MEDSITKIKLEALREALAAVEADNKALRAENSVFRIKLAKDLTEIAPRMSEETRSVWLNAPVEDFLIFYNLLERHFQIFTELAALRRKTVNAEKLKLRDQALIKEAEEYRKSSAGQPKHVQAAINQKLSKREKAIKQHAKALGITYESAARFIEEFEKTAAKKKE